MNSQFLESLIAVSQNGSIAEAARAQGLTPTAVSQRLKALEVEMGTALTLRAGKTVHLTEAATRILPHAMQILLLRKRETGKETAINFIWKHLIDSPK